MNRFLLLLIGVFNFSLCIAQHDTVVISDIQYHGLKRTNLKIVQREAPYKMGDSTNFLKLQHSINTHKNLLDQLFILNSVSISLDTLSPNSVRINYYLKESYPISFIPNITIADRNFNTWLRKYNADYQRLNYMTDINIRNIAGNNHHANIFLQVGFNRALGISYKIPNIGKKQRHFFQLNAMYSNSKQVNYIDSNNKQKFYRSDERFITQKTKLGISYFYRKALFNTHQLSAHYNNQQVDAMVLQLNPNYLNYNKNAIHYLDVEYNFKYRNVDNIDYPMQGKQIEAALNSKVDLQQNSVLQNSIYAHGLYASQLHKKWHASFIWRAKAAATYTDAYIFQIGLGYKNDVVRGYEYYVVNAPSFLITRLNLKYWLLDKNFQFNFLKTTYQYNYRVIPTLFTDYGKAYTNKAFNGNILANQSLYSIGAGVHFLWDKTALMRVEFVMNHLQEKGVFLNFITL